MSSTYKNVCQAPTQICQSHIRPGNSHSSHSKICRPHIILGNYSAPTQFLVNVGLLDILANSKNSLIIPSNWEFQLRDTSIHMIDKTCLLYRLQPFFNAEFEENAVLTIFYQLPVNTQKTQASLLIVVNPLNLSKPSLWQIKLYVFL